jgi:hypothetical protein
MEGLLKLAKREDARILFSGDTRQLQSVEASDDREQLREMLGVSTARPSASELAREQAPPRPAPRLDPQRPPLQTIEPSLLRQKDGYRRDLGMSDFLEITIAPVRHNSPRDVRLFLWHFKKTFVGGGRPRVNRVDC